MNTATLKLPKKEHNVTQNKPKASGLGLEGMGDLSSLLDAPNAAVGDGSPLFLEIDLIDEDPHQPRTQDNPGFSEESLDELAASINLRGVKTPISVRHNINAPGRYVINHGARRFRGSKRAGKTTIPGYIDNDYNEADQVVENLQRNELTAREIADYIGRELAKGIKRTDIAKSISKSGAFVTQHAALLDLPEPIAKVFNSGRAKDVTVVNELVTAFKKKPAEVSSWLADENQEITRGSVKMLREFLDEKNKNEDGEGEGEGEGSSPPSNDGKPASKKDEKDPDPEKLKKAILQVEHDGRPARIVLNRRPSSDGVAWLKYDDDGKEFEANLQSVKLLALLEG